MIMIVRTPRSYSHIDQLVLLLWYGQLSISLFLCFWQRNIQVWNMIIRLCSRGWVVCGFIFVTTKVFFSFKTFSFYFWGLFTTRKPLENLIVVAGRWVVVTERPCQYEDLSTQWELVTMAGRGCPGWVEGWDLLGRWRQVKINWISGKNILTVRQCGINQLMLKHFKHHKVRKWHLVEQDRKIIKLRLEISSVCRTFMYTGETQGCHGFVMPKSSSWSEEFSQLPNW